MTIKKLKTQSELWYIAQGSTNTGKNLIGYGTTHYLALCNALQLLTSSK